MQGECCRQRKLQTRRPRGRLGWCVRKCEEASRTAAGLCGAIVPLGRTRPGIRVSQRAGFHPTDTFVQGTHCMTPHIRPGGQGDENEF